VTERLAPVPRSSRVPGASSARFQVEYIERVLGGDAAVARSELELLRELLRRELGEKNNLAVPLDRGIALQVGDERDR